VGRPLGSLSGSGTGTHPGTTRTALDDALPIAHSLLGAVYAQYQQYEQAIAEGEQSIILAPNDAVLYANLAATLNYAGRPEDARRTAQHAIHLNPHAPLSIWSTWAGAIS